SLPPAPDRSPTPDSPVAQVLTNPRKDKQPSPLPPLSPEKADDVHNDKVLPMRSPTLDTLNPPVNSGKEKVSPTRPPNPNPPVNSGKKIKPAHSPNHDPPIDSGKEKVLPARSPAPDLPVDSGKRKQSSTPIAAIFNDNSPLMEEDELEDEEIIQPTKRKRKGVAAPRKKTSKCKSRK
ncbi:hypothetical protein BDR03DRAFT_1017970, partial [Suillus americanus]